MKILLAGKHARGAGCLTALMSTTHTIVGCIGPTGMLERDSFLQAAFTVGCPVYQPAHVNDPDFLATISSLQPDIIILAGFGQIVKTPFLQIAPHGCLNLHAGKLPQYRGSSPLNWALIRGEPSVTLSIIAVDTGVDTGDLYCEETLPVSMDNTIADLHHRANACFPRMLLTLLEQIEHGTAHRVKQTDTEASYFPLRFPEDGLIVWDHMSADEVHNRIRALTTPYPGAYTYFQGQRITLLASQHTTRPFYGEPGRIYQITSNGLLVAARDRCVWIRTTAPVIQPARYEKFATLRDALAHRTT